MQNNMLELDHFKIYLLEMGLKKGDMLDVFDKIPEWLKAEVLFPLAISDWEGLCIHHVLIRQTFTVGNYPFLNRSWLPSVAA